MGRSLLFLLIVSCFRLSFSWAQPDTGGQTGKGYLRAFVGAGSPVGDFGSFSMGNDLAGWARTGTTHGLAYDIGLARYLRVTARYMSARNRRDATAAGEAATEAFPGFAITATSDEWRVRTAGIGLAFTRPLNRTGNLQFDLYAIPGLAFVTFPQLTYYVKDIKTQDETVTYIEEKRSKVFAYSFGLRIQYFLSDAFVVYCQADYLGAEPRFDYEVSGSGYIHSYRGNYFDKRIQLFSTAFGLGLRLQ